MLTGKKMIDATPYFERRLPIVVAGAVGTYRVASDVASDVASNNRPEIQ